MNHFPHVNLQGLDKDCAIKALEHVKCEVECGNAWYICTALKVLNRTPVEAALAETAHELQNRVSKAIAESGAHLPNVVTETGHYERWLYPLHDSRESRKHYRLAWIDHMIKDLQS